MLLSQAVRATITYVRPAFTGGEASSSEPTHGRFHAFLPPGSHTLRFEAPGFAPRTLPAVIGAAGERGGPDGGAASSTRRAQPSAGIV